MPKFAETAGKGLGVEGSIHAIHVMLHEGKREAALSWSADLIG